MLANSWEGQFTLPIPLIAAACAAGSSSAGDAEAMPRSTSPTTSESERHALDSDATAHLTSRASTDLTRLNSTRTTVAFGGGNRSEVRANPCIRAVRLDLRARRQRACFGGSLAYALSLTHEGTPRDATHATQHERITGGLTERDLTQRSGIGGSQGYKRERYAKLRTQTGGRTTLDAYWASSFALLLFKLTLRRRQRTLRGTGVERDVCAACSANEVSRASLFDHAMARLCPTNGILLDSC